MIISTAFTAADLAEPIRFAAAQLRIHGWSVDAEVEVFDPDDPEELFDTEITDDTPVRLSGTGALMLADSRGPHGIYIPRYFDNEPIEAYNGFSSVTAVALYLVATGMAKPEDLSSETISGWCCSVGRGAEAIARMLEDAADIISYGTVPIPCTSCGAKFAWDTPLTHVERSSLATPAEFHSPWVIARDARAVCPVDDLEHRTARTELLLDAEHDVLIAGDARH